MTTQGLDSPDGPGWWAWESAYDDRRWVRHLIMWEEHGDGLVRMQWEDWSKPDLVYVDKFLTFNRGKWTRLHMPWEQPAPAAPYPVEVQPPAHILDMLLAEMEGDYCLDTLRFVIYNDAERDEWLRPAAPTIPDEVREALRWAVERAQEDSRQTRIDYGGVRADEIATELGAALAWLDAQRGEPTP